MDLNDYFDFVSDDEIILRGTRVPVEAILFEYLDGALPEELVVNYPPVTLEQIHATITYFLGHRSDMDNYLRRRIGSGQEAIQRQQEDASPLLDHLVQIRRSETRL